MSNNISNGKIMYKALKKGFDTAVNIQKKVEVINQSLVGKVTINIGNGVMVYANPSEIDTQAKRNDFIAKKREKYFKNDIIK